MLNRPAPPGFRGFDPHGEFRYYERHLPHWRQPGATYFVTFRLADALPQSVLLELRRVRRELARLGDHPSSVELRERYDRDVSRRFEGSLDEGHGRCELKDSIHASIVKKCLLFGHGREYFLGCGVIMSNHCHVVIRHEKGFELEDIFQKIKGISAREINQRTQRSGTLWEQEAYDRIIRDEEHLQRVIQYIGRNPVKCGLPLPYEFRWVHPLWKEAGWDFEDDDPTFGLMDTPLAPSASVPARGWARLPFLLPPTSHPTSS